MTVWLMKLVVNHNEYILHVITLTQSDIYLKQNRCSFIDLLCQDVLVFLMSSLHDFNFVHIFKKIRFGGFSVNFTGHYTIEHSYLKHL